MRHINNYRCSICNKVSAGNIQTNIGDISFDQFVADPKNKLHYLCSDCSGSINDIRIEYWDKDMEDDEFSKYLLEEEPSLENYKDIEKEYDRYSEIERLYGEDVEEH